MTGLIQNIFLHSLLIFTKATHSSHYLVFVMNKLVQHYIVLAKNCFYNAVNPYCCE